MNENAPRKYASPTAELVDVQAEIVEASERLARLGARAAELSELIAHGGYLTPSVLTTDEACEYLSISRATLFRYMKDDDFPVIRRGKVVRFRPDDLDKWMSNHCKAA